LDTEDAGSQPSANRRTTGPVVRPAVDWKPLGAFNPPAQSADAETIAEGHNLYQELCNGCHGLNAVSGLLIPDLRGSALLHDAAGWDNVLLGGALRVQGMASFADELDGPQSAAIRAYVIEQAIRGQRVMEQREQAALP